MSYIRGRVWSNNDLSVDRLESIIENHPINRYITIDKIEDKEDYLLLVIYIHSPDARHHLCYMSLLSDLREKQCRYSLSFETIEEH